MQERIITIYEIPESVEGDPYIRTPKEEDKSFKTYRVDRETGKIISLWEEKLRYPYKTKINSTLYIITDSHTYEFPIYLEDGTYIWNGSNIISFAWSLLGINQNSPCGLCASKWHDNILQFKQHFIDIARAYNPEITVSQFRDLTSKMYAQLLINYGVCKFKANLMGHFVNLWQRINPDWKKVY